ncbi:hypothetical protein OUZ56_032290 [Daphnia magna]|uniref:Uncharacterized protein n=1 Tax=Daphnia magna TaxID=35525 RepID=A0ABQ9ZWS8_9CRUS|nr:hypothetical protein OUZ56_032290 [Daphnia magna]
MDDDRKFFDIYCSLPIPPPTIDLASNLLVDDQHSHNGLHSEIINIDSNSQVILSYLDENYRLYFILGNNLRWAIEQLNGRSAVCP